MVRVMGRRLLAASLLIPLLSFLLPAITGRAQSGLGIPIPLTTPHNHFDGVVAAVGDKVLFAGGVNFDFQTPTDVVDIYDVITTQWTTAALSEPRSALASATIGSKVVFAGGWDFGDSARVDIYDAQTGGWSTAQLSQPRHYVSPVVVGQKVIFAGGWNGGETGTVDIWDTQTNAWSSTVLSQPTSGQYQAASVGTQALIATQGVIQIYDSLTNSWSIHPTGRDHSSGDAVTVGDKVLFAGGYGAGNTVDVYDSQTTGWGTATMSQGRYAFGDVALGPKAYFFGGIDLGGGSDAVIDIYDSLSGTWTTSSLPFPAWGIQPVTASGTLVLFVESSGNSALVYPGAVPHSPDLLPPSTVAVLSMPPNAGGGSNTTMAVTITSTDLAPPGIPPSGVAGIWVLDNGNPIPCLPASIAGSLSATCTASLSAEGIHTLGYQATDVAGNSEPLRTLPVVVGAALKMGPQAMEGNLTVEPGAVLEAGYDFTIPGNHPATDVTFGNPVVTFQGQCVTGGAVVTLTVGMSTQVYTDPLNDGSDWFPSGDQHTTLVYQGELPVPNLCAGGAISLAKGGIFTTTVAADAPVPGDGVHVRWHYSANGSAGSWSGTAHVQP